MAEPVYLMLSSTTSGQGLSFLMPEEFAVGYRNKISGVSITHTTHPLAHLWKGGSVQPINLKLELMAGISPKIHNSATLVRYIELLYDMALPVSEKRIEGVQISIGNTAGGIGWFFMNAFIENISAAFSPPIDVDTGMYMKAVVLLSLIPTFASPARTAVVAKSGATAGAGGTVKSSVPSKPWKFSG